MPIEEDFRLWATGGLITPRGPSDWFIADTDQRRIITVRMDEEQESEEVAVEYLRKHIDRLGPDVTLVHLAPDGAIVSTSSDPKHDPTECVYYPPLDVVQRPDGVQTIARSELRELDRLRANVDLVSYQPGTEPSSTTTAVFKYYWQFQFLESHWNELNLWMRLPRHPNIVPFDRLVLHQTAHPNHHRPLIVGFTVPYIPGGTLDTNPHPPRPFKLAHLHQLLHVIDTLNLRHGIAHQNITPRNLLIHPSTDTLLLTNFGIAARIGTPAHNPARRSDVTHAVFTLYEIITRDFHFRERTVWEERLQPEVVLGMEEWVVHGDVRLDREVGEYRAVVEKWMKGRADSEGGKQAGVYYKEAPECVDWPELELPLKKLGVRNDGSSWWVRSREVCERRRARAEGREVVEWQRPRQGELLADRKVDDRESVVNG